MKHKLLKISFKLSWQPKVNKRKAHLWWTLIQKEGRDILNSFNTGSIYVAIPCNGLELLRKGQHRQVIGSWALLGFRGTLLRNCSFFGWKKGKVGHWKWLLPYLPDTPPNVLWKKESHISWDQQAAAQSEVRLKFRSPLKLLYRMFWSEIWPHITHRPFS